MGSVRLDCRIFSPYSKTFKYNDNPVTFCYMKCHRIKVVLVEIRKKNMFNILYCFQHTVKYLYDRKLLTISKVVS
jgi:hypothetical protein